MKSLVIIAAICLPTFAIAQSAPVIEAPKFAAPTVPEKAVVQKEASVAKQEVSNATPKSVAKKEAGVAASQSGLEKDAKETKAKAKGTKVIKEDGSAVLRYGT
jgi:hypothetical protein